MSECHGRFWGGKLRSRGRFRQHYARDLRCTSGAFRSDSMIQSPPPSALANSPKLVSARSRFDDGLSAVLDPAINAINTERYIPLVERLTDLLARCRAWHLAAKRES